MISIKNPSIWTAKGPPQIPSSDPARLQSSRSVRTLSTRTVGSRTEPCPPDSSTGSARSQTVRPAGCELRFTSRRKIQQPDTSSSKSDFRTAPNVVSATELLNNPPRKTTTSPRPLTRPLYKLRGSRFRVMKLGIETEFYLAARNPINNRGNLPDFVTVLAENYNKQIPVHHPRMLETMRQYSYTGPYDKWCLLKDESLESNWLPWGVEMVSPIFRAFPNSKWREDVEATWRYLLKNYDIAESTLASTHIHIGLDTGYTFAEVKQTAQAVVHFESAFEVLVPRARRGNHYVKSNWLDAPGLGRANKSRSESIATIEAVIYPRALVEVLHPMDPSGSCYDRCYGWNFYSWLEKRSIEFRKPPASMSAKEVLSWAELAMSFVQAAIRCKSSQELQRIPPTMRGLRYFLQKYANNEPGVNEPGRLERLWRGRNLDAVLEPIPQAQDVPGPERPQLEPDLEARLRRMAAADKRRVQTMIKTARGQYG